ncbi:MAG TPA: hypothetical protein VH352_06915 [Pseudonocardiaceae bacterium]|nr:hypothetical protein [Pseudonocardiaceae bacterium]
MPANAIHLDQTHGRKEPIPNELDLHTPAHGITHCNPSRTVACSAVAVSLSGLLIPLFFGIALALMLPASVAGHAQAGRGFGHGPPG